MNDRIEHKIPSAPEAEAALLGSLLMSENGRLIDTISDLISSKDFYHEYNGVIYSAIEETVRRELHPDAVTVAQQLSDWGQLESDHRRYLKQLVEGAPIIPSVRVHASLISDKSRLREVEKAARNILNEVLSPSEKTSKEIITSAHALISSISTDSRGAGGFKDSREVLHGTVEWIQTAFESDGNLTGLPTGINEFDEMTSGLQCGDLVIVAGRPSMGKTSFAMNIAEHAALKKAKHVAVFSMEMPSPQIMARMLSSVGNVPFTRMRKGDLDNSDWTRISAAIALVSGAKISIDDSPSLSPADLRSRLTRLIQEKGQIDLIIVDYLQLMMIPGFKEGRNAEISEISRSLKAIAKELSVPLIALSQLNRSVESRTNKRPILSDLRESGAIEQDADLIVFIYRDEVYNPESERKGTAEIILGKQRNGPIGTCYTSFRGDTTRFDNLEAAYNSYPNE